ncbi:MAG: nitrilase-related carbon-nitrogen hydrolase [Planctomycetota bacterium]
MNRPRNNGLRRAAAARVRLVVLPEMWPTSFADPLEAAGEALAATPAAVHRIGELSRELGLVAGGSAYGSADGEAKPRNRMHVFDRGELVLSYDKVHLFSPTAEDESFSAGDEPPPTVEASAGRLSAIVCYDLRFGPLVRVPQAEGAEILLVSAQWPATRAGHWRTLLAGRAVEAQLFVVAANRTGTDFIGRRRLELSFPGNSCVVDPHGRVRAAGPGGAGLVRADIDLAQVRRVRRQVLVRDDERRDLYVRWSHRRTQSDRG